MPLSDVTIPYELLIRFGEDGGLRGAHYQTRRIISDGDTILADQLGPAQPVTSAIASDPGVPITDVLGTVLTAAIIRSDQETARATAAEEALATAREEVSRLTEALAAASPASPPVVDPNDVPASVTAFQARAALLAAGLLDEVEAAVAAADRLTQTAWEYAQAFERTSPTIAALAAALGLTDAQLDDLFRAAAAISA